MIIEVNINDIFSGTVNQHVFKHHHHPKKNSFSPLKIIFMYGTWSVTQISKTNVAIEIEDDIAMSGHKYTPWVSLRHVQVALGREGDGALMFFCFCHVV